MSCTSASLASIDGIAPYGHFLTSSDPFGKLRPTLDYPGLSCSTTDEILCYLLEYTILREIQ